MENVEIKVRKDIGDMVKNISFTRQKTRFNLKKVVLVTLFNDDTIVFSDRDGLYDLYATSMKLGENIIKDMRLVEDIKTDIDDTSKKSTYVCVLVTLITGEEYRLFVDNRADNNRIDLYYNVFKRTKKASA